MTPGNAYDWLAPKLSDGERQALDVIYAATKAGTDEVLHPLGTPVDMRPVLAMIPQQRQRQDATDAQLRDLQAVANRLGMYDAADVLRGLLEHTN
ncbi:hypothetical protein ACUH78_18260 [Thauera sp. ZXT1-4]|uniref:hypothetical protein n=1 Tax=Thauera sp. ZXT1-4 TaxID=3460294 RepID=UPI004040A0EA